MFLAHLQLQLSQVVPKSLMIGPAKRTIAKSKSV